MVNQLLPKVTLIVTTFNNEETIDACLKSIFNLDYPKSLMEIFLIDACSKDSTGDIAKKYPIKMISKSLNAPAAYNFAIKRIKTNIIGFIDSDAKLDPKWLNTLVKDLTDPQVAGVSGSIETWNNENKWARSIGYDLQNRYDRIKKPVIRIATMNLLMKKKIIEEVGGFDENLASQYDTDLGFRISEKGYQILLNSEAKCYHFNRANLRSYFLQQLQYGQNTLKLYFKHNKLIRGDEITDFGMNIQPPLFLSAIIFLFFGLIEVLRSLWFISAIIFCFLFFYYLISSIVLLKKFRDSTTLLLIILYPLRLIAWCTGATITSINYLLGRKSDSK